jgi:large subunit ribosomal protein L2
MPVKKFRPTTSTLRFKTIVDYSVLTNKRPEKRFLRPIKKSGGRNFQGNVTSRHRGGGHKRRYRIVDFYRKRLGIRAVVQSVEYDPNRTAFIAPVTYNDGTKTYVLAPDTVRPGDEMLAGPGVPVKTGNAMPLGEIPGGTDIHCMELSPGRGAQVARSAGSYCTVVAKEDGMVQVRMPSGEIRLVPRECYAVVGQMSNPEHEKEVVGSAGRSRWMGRRPKVRGVAMNPIDHPMGGGEGKSSGGGHPVSPWGKKAKGQKTRKQKKASSRFILKRRIKKKKTK